MYAQDQSNFTSTICIENKTCITTICIIDEPCENIKSNLTNITGQDISIQNKTNPPPLIPGQII